MKTACLAAFAALRGALLFAALASIADAQNQTWIQQFGTSEFDVAYAAAPDGSSGVYVSGDTGGNLGGQNMGARDVWLARHDSAGNQTWIRQFGTSSSDYAYAAAPDGAGGVFVSGFTQGSIGGPNAGLADVWIARHDSAGNQTWIRQFGASSSDYAYAAAPDGAGGVFVSGFTHGSLGGPNAGLADVWIARYDGVGNQTWIRQLGTFGCDEAWAAAPDGSGGVFVSGTTEGNLGGLHAGFDDAWLAHYDGAGNQTWIRQFGTPARDSAGSVAPDGAGGVFVSGRTEGNLGGPSAGGRDAWIAHYDGAGNQTWIRQFGSTSNDYDGVAAPDGAGGVFVGGSTSGSLAGQHAGVWDVWLAHYDSVGNRTWIRQFGSGSYESSHGAASDGAGGVFVSGFTYGSLAGPNAGGFDSWLAHYDSLDATLYCTPAISNSTGQPGELTATGSNTVVASNLTVAASQLQQQSFGFFQTSMTQGVTTNPGGSQGDLCLGGSIGRFVGPGQIMNSGTTGSFALAINLNAMPTPTGFVAVQPGDTWNFQAWYRDANPGPTSNFTDAVSVTFL